MERWAGKVAVVTGASAGIGLAIAKMLVRDGLIVVGVARRDTKMQEEMKKVTGPGKFYARKCDVTKNQEIIDTFQWVKKEFGTVHVLINNAGSVKFSKIEDTSMEDIEFILNLNLVGAICCAKEAIKLIKENGEEGLIININSVAGHNTLHIPGFYNNVYSPSKFALRSFSDVLAHELKGLPIRITNLSPGAVLTDINKDFPGLKERLGGVPFLQAEDIAASVRHVISAPPHVRISELTIQPLGEIL